MTPEMREYMQRFWDPSLPRPIVIVLVVVGAAVLVDQAARRGAAAPRPRRRRARRGRRAPLSLFRARHLLPDARRPAGRRGRRGLDRVGGLARVGVPGRSGRGLRRGARGRRPPCTCRSTVTRRRAPSSPSSRRAGSPATRSTSSTEPRGRVRFYGPRRRHRSGADGHRRVPPRTSPASTCASSTGSAGNRASGSSSRTLRRASPSSRRSAAISSSIGRRTDLDRGRGRPGRSLRPQRCRIG